MYVISTHKSFSSQVVFSPSSGWSSNVVSSYSQVASHSQVAVSSFQVVVSSSHVVPDSPKIHLDPPQSILIHTNPPKHVQNNPHPRRSIRLRFFFRGVVFRVQQGAIYIAAKDTLLSKSRKLRNTFRKHHLMPNLFDTNRSPEIWSYTLQTMFAFGIRAAASCSKSASNYCVEASIYCNMLPMPLYKHLNQLRKRMAFVSRSEPQDDCH